MDNLETTTNASQKRVHTVQMDHVPANTITGHNLIIESLN